MVPTWRITWKCRLPLLGLPQLWSTPWELFLIYPALRPCSTSGPPPWRPILLLHFDLSFQSHSTHSSSFAIQRSFGVGPMTGRKQPNGSQKYQQRDKQKHQDGKSSCITKTKKLRVWMKIRRESRSPENVRMMKDQRGKKTRRENLNSTKQEARAPGPREGSRAGERGFIPNS